ncbi:dirigent protein 22 isoform X2 [Gossypium raimondii]|uniref:dirigent protein 22 isoform X2 n=1 Tax=Gossypium raimondii TaxID=29730 RepID=UPI00227AA50F|nr:dirigent protein 22 isoform X2 [Gossypium raimondii]
MVASVLKTQSFIIFLILFFITIITSFSRLTVAYGYSELFGKNITGIRVVDGKPSTNRSSQFMFGDVYVIDDPLTIEPDINSKTVGKAQGTYTVASQGELSLLMVTNFAFTEGKYNGSTLSVLGRNEVLSTAREIPIVGGSGVFRFARGYAQVRTQSINQARAIVEYNVFVFHYR